MLPSKLRPGYSPLPLSIPLYFSVTCLKSLVLHVSAWDKSLLGQIPERLLVEHGIVFAVLCQSLLSADTCLTRTMPP